MHSASSSRSHVTSPDGSRLVDRIDDAVTGTNEAELVQIVRDFRGTSLDGFVAVDWLTGMRRNEALALRWVDVRPAPGVPRSRTLLLQTYLER
jgi:integrase